MVLNLLCSRLMEKDNANLLQVFFNVDSDTNGGSGSRFLIFSILVDFLHRDGIVGHHARDAILLVMSLSKKHDDVGRHIAKSTSFCPVLNLFKFNKIGQEQRLALLDCSQLTAVANAIKVLHAYIYKSVKTGLLK